MKWILSNRWSQSFDSIYILGISLGKCKRAYLTGKELSDEEIINIWNFQNRLKFSNFWKFWTLRNFYAPRKFYRNLWKIPILAPSVEISAASEISTTQKFEKFKVWAFLRTSNQVHISFPRKSRLHQRSAILAIFEGPQKFLLLAAKYANFSEKVAIFC